MAYQRLRNEALNVGVSLTVCPTNKLRHFARFFWVDLSETNTSLQSILYEQRLKCIFFVLR